MKYKKHKISNIIILLGCLIFFLTIIIFRYYSVNLNDKIIEISEIEIKKWTKRFLSENIGYDLLVNNKLNSILDINTNNDDEILYVNYNLNNSYAILEDITTEITNKISDLEKGNSINDRNINSNKYGLYLKVPLLIASNNVLLASLGPKIIIPINFIGSILTNLKTKITDYGLNNALVELYVTIEITEELITPVTKREIVINYDVLIASKVINGRVPEIYGGGIYAKSNAFSIPIQ
jgi:sporulation protein YunB